MNCPAICRVAAVTNKRVAQAYNATWTSGSKGREAATYGSPGEASAASVTPGSRPFELTHVVLPEELARHDLQVMTRERRARITNQVFRAMNSAT
jgi:hypothetical protein